MQVCHVPSLRLTPSLQSSPPAIIRTPMPWSLTIRTTAMSPRAQLLGRDRRDMKKLEEDSVENPDRRELGNCLEHFEDYERLADFIPGLAVSKLVEKTDTYIGEQKLAFGINFNAKGIVDCYEKDLETLPFGQRLVIEFKMIERDFQLFEGKWSIEQYNIERFEEDNTLVAEEFRTTLSHVDVKPKLWLPVGLVEGRLCKDIKMNLSCIREEAQRRS